PRGAATGCRRAAGAGTGGCASRVGCSWRRILAWSVVRRVAHRDRTTEERSNVNPVLEIPRRLLRTGRATIEVGADLVELTVGTTSALVRTVVRRVFGGGEERAPAPVPPAPPAPPRADPVVDPPPAELVVERPAPPPPPP